MPPVLLENLGKQSQWRFFLDIALLITRAQRNPNSDEDSHVALNIYREAYELTKQWLPVVEDELRHHGLLDGSGGEAQAREQGDDGADGPSKRCLSDKKAFMALAKKAVLMGMKRAVGKEAKGDGQGSVWRTTVLKEMHGVIGMFMEDAEGEIERLERLLGGKDFGQNHSQTHLSRRCGASGDRDRDDDGKSEHEGHVHSADHRSVPSYAGGSTRSLELGSGAQAGEDGAESHVKGLSKANGHGHRQRDRDRSKGFSNNGSTKGFRTEKNIGVEHASHGEDSGRPSTAYNKGEYKHKSNREKRSVNDRNGERVPGLASPSRSYAQKPVKPHKSVAGTEQSPQNLSYSREPIQQMSYVPPPPLMGDNFLQPPAEPGSGPQLNRLQGDSAAKPGSTPYSKA